MKTIQLCLVATVILVAVSAISFMVGREYESYYYNIDNLFEQHQQLKSEYDKTYQAACVMSDAIRAAYDGKDNSSYCALENICCEIKLNTDSLLNHYSWCY